MHILSPETDNCPSWISGRERMTVENISWSISTKECCRPRRGLNPGPPGLQSDGASNWATEAGYVASASKHSPEMWADITKTCLYNFDRLKPHFYIVKLGFIGVYIILLISAQNIDHGYSLEPPRRGGSNKYPQSVYWAEIWKISVFYLKIFGFWRWNFLYIWIGVFS